MDQLWWYVARSAGIVSWGLLAASVLWGLALSTKVFGKRPRPNWLLDLHQWLGTLTMVFIGVHVAGLMLDSYTHFGVTDVLVPFASDWDPSAVAWGVVAFYLLLAVEGTALARRWLPKKVWRSVHYLSFPVFVLATVHGVAAGTDATTTFAVATVVVVVAMVAMLSFVRLDQAARQADLAAQAVAPTSPPPARGATRQASSARPAPPPPGASGRPAPGPAPAPSGPDPAVRLRPSAPPVPCDVVLRPVGYAPARSARPAYPTPPAPPTPPVRPADGGPVSAPPPVSAGRTAF